MYLAVDIGGTKTLVATFDSEGNKIHEKKFPTDNSYNDFLRDLEKNVAEISTSNYAAGAIGTRGIVDRKKGQLVADDILSWENATLVDDLSNIYKCDFIVENDSKAAGVAEANEVSEFSKVVYITLSTGIGVAYLENGRIVESLQDMEMGKIPLENEGKIQEWEEFASGKAIFEKYGLKASEIHDSKSWDEIAGKIAYGVSVCCCILQPEVIIFGGGAGRYANNFIGGVVSYIDKNIADDIRRPRLLQTAKYPDDCVVRGCFLLLKQKGLVDGFAH